jgi:ABC-type glycerol-3-phosphate transport system substrate-binding protein
MGRTVVTSACKHPDRAIEYLDFIASDEGHMLTAYGIEGVEYKIEDGVVKRLIEAPEIISKGIAAYNVYTNNPTPPYSAASKKDTDILMLGIKYGVYGAQLFSAAPSAKEYGQTLRDLVKEQYLKMILGDGDIDKMFSDFVNAYMQNGGEKLGKENYEIYKAQGN